MGNNLNPRRLTRYQIVVHLKRRGVRQYDIAKRARVSQTLVNFTISRLATPSERTERVWREIEKVFQATPAGKAS